MSLLLRWWRHPADYAWTTTYHRTTPILRRAHVLVGIWCWLYAVLCILGANTPAGTTGIGRSSVHILAASLIVIGAGWMLGPFPDKATSYKFVAYLEFTYAAGSLMLSDPSLALASAAALGVIGNYIAAFHGPKLFLAHQVWALVLVVTLFARAVMAPHADVVLALSHMVGLTLVLFSAPILTQALLLLLRSDAATAFYDPLTGLCNRRGLDVAMTEYREHTSEPSPSVTVMVVDLDGFKLVNDRFGHAYGDLVLRSTGSAIRAAFPPPAITARTGGEEFAILTLAGPADAIEQADALRRDRTAAHPEVGATVSIGIAETGASPRVTGFAEALDRADAAMYAAKYAGGNTIYFHNGVSTTPARQ